MSDVLFVIGTVAFFAVASLLVSGCERVVAGDADPLPEPVPVPPAEVRV